MLLGFALGCNALSGVQDFSVVGETVQPPGNDVGVDASSNQESAAVEDGAAVADTTTAGDARGSTDALAEADAGGGATDGEALDATDTGTSTAIRIRCGVASGDYVDSLGNTWIHDEDYSPVDGTLTTTSSVVVTGTNDPALYQNQRYANASTLPSGFTYTFDVPAGPYVVNLLFAEVYDDPQAGVGFREFDVAIDSVPVLTNFDIVATVGWGHACVKTFSATVTSGSPLTVQFSPGAAQNPMINAIEILSGSPGGG